MEQEHQEYLNHIQKASVLAQPPPLCEDDLDLYDGAYNSSFFRDWTAESVSNLKEVVFA